MSHIRLQSTPIDSAELTNLVRGEGDGAVALFLGTVRNHNEGRRVRYMEYHAYPEMAEREMSRLADEAVKRFDIHDVALVHRTGRLEIGEASVAVAVSSAHRGASMDACRYLIDTLKQTVPVWKREFFEGGDEWL